MGEQASPFKAEILPDFVFDDTSTEVVIAGDEIPVPTVNSITPSAGTVGTKIQISGSNLGSSGLGTVSLGGNELNINSVSEDRIEAHVPYGAQSGNIELTFANQKIDAGHFDVLPQQKQLLLENEIGPSAKPQTVAAKNISVTIPGNAIESKRKIRIEQIADPHPINLPESISGTAFSITVADMHSFNDSIAIVYPLASGAQGQPCAAYFDENTSLWNTLPSEVIDGKLYIYTNHLTDFMVFYWGESVYSPDGYFKIYYQKKDTFNYGSSMDDLARKVGATLEEVRKNYEAKIPAAYRENFSYMSFPDSMDVYLDSGYSHGQYNALTNNLLLPTSYPGENDFETVLAHEFFHANQDTVWNETNIIGKMVKTENKWAVEALAELAAYELAFPEKNRRRTVSAGVSSQDPYNTFDEVHEYSMSCFLSYLLKKTNSTFEELWIYVASSKSYLISTSLNNFFKSKSSDFISLEASYTKFWRDVVGNADAPLQSVLDSQFNKRMIYFKPNVHSAVFKYQTGKSPTTALNLFAPYSFSENMPLRIFNMECIAGSTNGVWSTRLSGVRSIGDLNGARVPGGHSWVYSYAKGAPSDKYELYEFKKGSKDMVLVALDSDVSNELSGVKISEIQANCIPAKIEGAAVGQEYEFSFAFKDIFQRVSDVMIEVDFGDGEIAKYQHKNENGMLSGKITHTFDKSVGTAVRCSLYDVSQGGKDLISRLVIPVTAQQPEITQTPTPTEEAPSPTVAAPKPTLETPKPTVAAPESTKEASNTSKFYGTWRGIFDYMGYTDGYYFAETIQFNADGTFSSYYSAVTLDGSSEIPLADEYLQDEGPFLPKSGTFTFDEKTSKGTTYYTYLGNSNSFDFKYENDQLTCGSWRYERVQ